MVQKNAELVDADLVYKFRYVFQGNRVTDQNYTTAMFQDLGSSPATMEASKAADLVGCAPGNTIEQADAEQAYVQAVLKGPETWVQLPEEHWPDHWKGLGLWRPVVRLKKALYGHPDSGTFWEQKCDERCKAVGFRPIPDWPSCYWHDGYGILLVIYVDDFKMGGPPDKLKKAWADLRRGPDGLIIEQEQPAGNFLGCTHERGTMKLPNGQVVNTMTYNMEPFLRSCNDVYLHLAREAKFNANLRFVPTPFVPEDQKCSPQAKLLGDGPALF